MTSCSSSPDFFSFFLIMLLLTAPFHFCLTFFTFLYFNNTCIAFLILHLGHLVQWWRRNMNPSTLTPLPVWSTWCSRGWRRGLVPQQREWPAWQGSLRSSPGFLETRAGGCTLQIQAGSPYQGRDGWCILELLCWCQPKRDEKASFHSVCSTYTATEVQSWLNDSI